MTYDVAVGIVTYGNRGALCVSSVVAALRAGAGTVVVILNGVSQRSEAALHELALEQKRLRLVDLGWNTGSAVGFTKALSEARLTKHRYTLLLDDDNVIASNGLGILLEAHRHLEHVTGADAVVFGFRETSPWHRSLVSQGVSTYPPAGSFMNFDLWARLRTPAPGSPDGPGGTWRVTYGPYGGMFTTSKTALLTLPRPELFLYEDDTDYTYKLSRSGVSLWLVPQAVIMDADRKWTSSGSNGSGPSRLLLSDSGFRRYYSTRNRVALDLARCRGLACKTRFVLNASLYLLFLTLEAAKLRRHAALIETLRAVRHGIAGRFGIDYRANPTNEAT